MIVGLITKTLMKAVNSPARGFIFTVTEAHNTHNAVSLSYCMPDLWVPMGDIETCYANEVIDRLHIANAGMSPINFETIK